MLKKFLCLCLFCLCILSCKKTKDIVKPIENDCEVLKQYLQNAAIDVSLAIDDGLDINNILIWYSIFPVVIYEILKY